MSNQYYECHVTLQVEPPRREALKDIILHHDWKFSCIDGDPVLGEGVKAYATRQFKGTMDREVVLQLLQDMADLLEHYHHYQVVRRKVELVIYDDRSSKVTFECKGGCPECHTEDA